MRIWIVLFFSILLVSASTAEPLVREGKLNEEDFDSPTTVDVFRNPLEVSLGDPQILQDGGMYYLYGTTFDTQGFEVWSSSDLVHWRKHGFCWQKSASTWAQRFLWAPEAIKVGETYYLFYTGATAADPRLRVCVASSDSPLGPFTDLQAPLIGMGEVNHFDPSIYLDPVTNDCFLYYTVDTTQSGSNFSEIRCVRLASDMKSFIGFPVMCIKGDQDWEYTTNNKYFIEGPYVIRRGNYYYMQYSGNAWNTPSYGVGYATATSQMGPWTKSTENPVLQATESVPGPGHGCFTQSPDRSEWFIVYHSLVTNTSWNRELNIDRIGFFDAASGPPRLRLFDGATRQPQLFPVGSAAKQSGVDDEFDAPLDRTLWRIVNEDANWWEIKDGSLTIRAQNGEVWLDRTDGKNIFLQYAPSGDFVAETKITFNPVNNHEKAFLTVWQDQNNYVSFGPMYYLGMGLPGPILYAVVERNAVRSQSVVANPFVGSPVHIRFARTGNHCQPLYSGDGETWTPLGTGFELNTSGPLQVGVGAFSPDVALGPYASFDYLRFANATWKQAGISDEFEDAQLDRSLWTIYHEVAQDWTLEDGSLSITTDQGDFWRSRADAKNLFLQRAPQSDFRLTAQINLTPLVNYEQAKIVIWQDHNNYLRLTSVYDDGLKLEAAREIEGVYTNTSIPNPFGSDLQLAIEKKDGHYRYFASSDGEDWLEIGSGYADPFAPDSATPLRIGFGAMAPESGAARTARFDWFRVTPTEEPSALLDWSLY